MHFSPPQKLMLRGGAMFVLPAAIDNGGEVCSWIMIAGIVLYVWAVAWMGVAWVGQILSRERIGTGSKVAEWFDIAMTKEILFVIDKGIETGDCKIRYRSADGMSDRDLDASELQRMQMVMLAFTEKNQPKDKNP